MTHRLWHSDDRARADCLRGTLFIGLALIYMPRVPAGKIENYRVGRSQPADFARVPISQDAAVSRAEIARNSAAKTPLSTLYFSGDFNAFHRAETGSLSTTCEDDIRVARNKLHVFIATLGT